MQRVHPLGGAHRFHRRRPRRRHHADPTGVRLTRHSRNGLRHLHRPPAPLLHFVLGLSPRRLVVASEQIDHRRKGISTWHSTSHSSRLLRHIDRHPARGDRHPRGDRSDGGESTDMASGKHPRIEQTFIRVSGVSVSGAGSRGFADEQARVSRLGITKVPAYALRGVRAGRGGLTAGCRCRDGEHLFG